ncbi:aminopeptidase P family protein [Neisseria lisongii]|uniref:Aminopeptidase P family protein n=1 Tax=Neisseria lisongii TaxID=2912188 RepID=A0AAW5ALL6_9NEIS|nr:aminopeptidase P family protein [Neisseria lisongii]MCF7530059.1 aminopeptidase P family protein [Neisseria lisongii]
MNVPQKLAALRAAMKTQGLDAWIVPSADPHLSEYLPEHWQARVYFSGFTGSVGTLVVTADEAGLWADSRYWEQAASQLSGSGIELQKMGEVAPYSDWLAQVLPPNAAVGVAADTLSLSAKRGLESVFAAKNIRLDTAHDLSDSIWHERPDLPNGKIYVHDAAFVSETAAEKLARVRAAMAEQNAAWHLISSLDDIAWLTNLRGDDVSYNPVFLSYLLIGEQTATLFVDESKLNTEAKTALQAAAIDVAPYGDIVKAVGEISDGLLINADKTAVSTLAQLPSTVQLIENINPSTLFKSIKSDADLAHVREAMRQDGAALCGFFAEFERNLANGTAMNELDIDTMLHDHRSRRPNFVSLSFNTIAGYNANGALPHYSATPEAFSQISGNGLLLIDSGAQYLGGTTDITRVVPVGDVSDEQKRDYTLVLKAHIALAETVFPENIGSSLLDAICRKPLWQAQCEYGHGTGHGVGYFMNVHEGPQVISYHATPSPHHAMKIGMITSNEPGLYRSGKWGIRIENLVANRAVENPQETDFGKFLYFETLTLCPIDTRPIDKALMSTGEIAWLNAYHAQVREALLPLVDGEAKDWLLLRTEAI